MCVCVGGVMGHGCGACVTHPAGSGGGGGEGDGEGRGRGVEGGRERGEVRESAQGLRVEG